MTKLRERESSDKDKLNNKIYESLDSLVEDIDTIADASGNSDADLEDINTNTATTATNTGTIATNTGNSALSLSKVQKYADAKPQLRVKATTSSTSDTYQATTHVNKLHKLTSKVDLLIEHGTGSSVTVTAGLLLVAGTEYWYTPETGKESLGYAILDTSVDTAFSATKIVTIAVCE